MKRYKILILCLLTLAALPSCKARQVSSAAPKVLVVEPFLADISRNVAGERLSIDSLIPVGIDPHAFEPTPRDVAKISDSTILILNGAGLEGWLKPVLANAGGERFVIEAAAGLANRKPDAGVGSGDPSGEIDPHFWLDPVAVIHYVENIRDGLSKADRSGSDIYTKNADAYIARLRELDAWIRQQVQMIPPARRLLVTNHEEFGYFADRYGFKVIGAIIPSFTTEASPSAQAITQLIQEIKESGAPAIFLESNANSQLAEQVAVEAGVKVVTDLRTHSITDAGGVAPTYIDMIRYNTLKIVEALK